MAARNPRGTEHTPLLGGDGHPSDEAFMSHLQHDAWFGKKTIGALAGIALLINNITGPGVPSLPNMFAESGWLVPTIVFILVWAMSSLSTTMFCEAMRKIPRNEHFRGRIEYSSIVQYYFGRKGYIMAQIGLNGALQSLNVISVIQSAQVMDGAIAAIAGKSCALNVSPFAIHVGNHTLPESTDVWSCIDVNNVDVNPWGCHIMLSIGFVLAAAITLPMGYFNLDDNMIVQVVAFVLTIVCWCIWLLASFFSEAFASGNYAIPAVNSHPSYGSQAGVLGTILFNFGFVTTVPSWVNEKKVNVSVNKTVWLATSLCNLIFFVIGIPGCMAFAKYLAGPATNKCADPEFGCADSIMTVFTTQDMAKSVLTGGDGFWMGKGASFVLKLSVYMFPIVAVLSSIPVFSIVIKYNCVENGFSHTFSFLWGVVFPWVVAFPLLYQPDALNQFITFSSLIFVSFTDFIVPWWLYIVLQRKELHSKVPHELHDERTKHLQDEGPSASDYPSELLATPDHVAIPEAWRIPNRTKIGVALAMVVIMAAAAFAGTGLQIQTSASAGWDCAAVSL
eukprot:m.89093 g.89093  ORF g.89093 m.89093 type:complete len:562 (+) comp14964_c0_seq2:148-1833(+)